MNCELPDACGNDIREEKLLAAQNKDDDRSLVARFLQRDKILFIAIIVILILMQFQTGRYVLYPIDIFTTWVHEMSHGTAAILVGGKIKYLHIYHDGSGLAAYVTPSGISWKKAIVSSAGYTGTAFWGSFMLLFRRTTLGPTIGTIGFGIAIILSCILYVRNTFGVVVLSIEGLLLVIGGWFLPALWVDNLYAFLAVTCSMNALIDIRNLFGSGDGYVGGEPMETDAQQVSDYWGMDYRFWAISWFVWAIVATSVGLLFAKDAKELKRSRNRTSSNQNRDFEMGVPVKQQPPTQFQGNKNIQVAEAVHPSQGLVYWGHKA